MKEGRTKRGIARCRETSVRRHERYCKAVVSKRRAVQGGESESMKEGSEDEARHRKMLRNFSPAARKLLQSSC